MTAKVEALFREYPWVKDLHPLMPKATSVQMLELGPDNVQETQCGLIHGVEHPYDSYGFFIGFGGRVVGTVHPKGSDFRNWKIFDHAVRFVTAGTQEADPKDISTVESVARKLPYETLAGVRYVVVVRLMHKNLQSIPITFIKVSEHFKLVDVLAYLDTVRRGKSGQKDLFEK